MKRQFIFFVLITLLVIACNHDSNGITGNDDYNNIPTVANTLNAFTYTVNAINFSTNFIDSLSFDSDSLACTLIVANYISGYGVISILDSCSTKIFNENLTSNKVMANVNIIGKVPVVFSIQLDNFRGSVTFVLAGCKN